MKQVILLEEHEVKRLNRGRQIEITTPSGTLVIGFELPSPLRAIKNGDDRTDANYCKAHNKTFKNAHGLAVHNSIKHGGKS